ncbi:MAG: ATP-dependent DNA helicase [Polyangiaceae bacterium]|nr:ATP-dependent DNA helicase [Polyangiaceae bacterium]
MAELVERALDGDRKVVVEAGTGTGKTLAYLVPAILSGRKIIVSTATRALQDQIVSKDLPLLAEHAGLCADVAVLKGLSNYLCRRRLAELARSEEGGRPATRATLERIERWRHETETGDLSELVSIPEGDPVRAEISSSSETRLGRTCSYFDECFVTRARRDADRARIVVVNHALFFADLALRGPKVEAAALPAYDAVIFDEAHHLEDVASQVFGVRVSSARIGALVRDASRAFSSAGLGPLLDPRSETRRVTHAIERASSAFFSGLAAGVGPETRAELDPRGWADAEMAAYHALDASLEAAEQLGAATPGESAEAIGARAASARADLAAIVDGRRHAVAWIESSARAVSVSLTPVDVADELREKLFEPVPVTVLTSATLSTSSGFTFLRERLGLDDATGPVDEACLPSPFDHASACVLYVPRDLPEVSAPGFVEAAADRVAELVGVSDGGAFVLCTSLRAMRALHAALARRRVPRLLVQGDAPKSSLVSRFRASGSSVLVATMSFWEGVDVPGRALRLVVIDRLPFPVPTDPQIVARGRALEEAGKSPFERLHLPTASITLKQGFGRLLRATTDRGVVAVLDRRLVTRGYGKALLAALPPARMTHDLADALGFLSTC